MSHFNPLTCVWLFSLLSIHISTKNDVIVSLKNDGSNYRILLLFTHIKMLNSSCLKNEKLVEPNYFFCVIILKQLDYNISKKLQKQMKLCESNGIFFVQFIL